MRPSPTAYGMVSPSGVGSPFRSETSQIVFIAIQPFSPQVGEQDAALLPPAEHQQPDPRDDSQPGESVRRPRQLAHPEGVHREPDHRVQRCNDPLRERPWGFLTRHSARLVEVLARASVASVGVTPYRDIASLRRVPRLCHWSHIPI